MAKNFTLLQVKVLELFFTSLQSKVTRYLYFVTSQHCVIESYYPGNT